MDIRIETLHCTRGAEDLIRIVSNIINRGQTGWFWKYLERRRYIKWIPLWIYKEKITNDSAWIKCRM